MGVTAIGLAAFLTTSAAANEMGSPDGVVGNWIITSELDQFTKGLNVFMDLHSGKNLLSFRCFYKPISEDKFGAAIGNYSVALGLDAVKFIPGNKYKIKYRFDKGEVEDANALASDENTLVFTTFLNPDLFIDKKEINMRVEADYKTIDLGFKFFSTAAAFDIFNRYCP